jgi:acetyl-CoA C-acetyltransferase
MYRDGFMCPLSGMVMGETAERLSSIYEISRDQQDEYAAESHDRAKRATQSGRFKHEIASIEISMKHGTTKFDTDEHVRADISVEQMKMLPPGTITVGNFCGITEYSSGIYLMGPWSSIFNSGLRRTGLPSTLSRSYGIV